MQGQPAKVHQVPWMLQGREMDETSIVAFSSHLNRDDAKNNRIIEL